MFEVRDAHATGAGPGAGTSEGEEFHFSRSIAVLAEWPMAACVACKASKAMISLFEAHEAFVDIDAATRAPVRSDRSEDAVAGQAGEGHDAGGARNPPSFPASSRVPAGNRASATRPATTR